MEKLRKKMCSLLTLMQIWGIEMTNKTIFTLGDALITFNPSAAGPLRYVSSFERKVGGAELNFAIGCARLGLDVKWMSRLGGDEFGKYIYKTVRGEGINMSEVKLVDGYPSSLNFKEVLEDGSGKTFYYRYQSPISTLTPDDIKPELFHDVAYIHLTGVFLAIAENNLHIVLKILDIAKERNIPVAFDPNIRLKLWTIEEARAAYFRIFPYVDVLLTGLDEIEMIVGDVSLASFAEQYTIEQLVIKDGANGSKAYIAGEWYEAAPFNVKPVDTVGAGDGFDAAYIYGLMNDYGVQERLTFANAVGAMVTTVKGDNEGLPEYDEVQIFLGNKTAVER